jgi:glycosyltransferase involved in cell wall biosynthesis
MRDKNFFIATSRLVDYSGAEVNVLELVEVFSNRGYKVFVGALEITSEFREIFTKYNAKIINLNEDNCFAEGVNFFEIAWIQHNVVAYKVLLNPFFSAASVIYSSLSHFEPLESPPVSSLKVSRYLVNSEENLKNFNIKYPELSDCVFVFPNAATKKYWELGEGRVPSVKLKKIAIVSNHLPVELSDAIFLIKKRNVEIEVFGVSGKKILITPETLIDFDAVITIGKTVQYCLALKIPVYCYDHLGGDGWLTKENYNSSRIHNFSGRLSRGKIDSKTIEKEIIDGYFNAINELPFLYEEASKKFRLEDNLDKLNLSTAMGGFIANINIADKNILAMQYDLFVRQRGVIENAHYAADELKLKLKKMNEELTIQKKNNSEINFKNDLLHKQLEIELINNSARNDEVENIKSSICFKVVEGIKKFISPFAALCTRSSVSISWGLFLIKKSILVIRHQGWNVFIKRVWRYTSGAVRRIRANLTRGRKSFGSVEGKSKSTDILVSFVIPVYDRTDVLREAIKSALNQTIRAIEVIIVTDGSPEQTLEVVNEFSSDPRVKIFKFPKSSGNAVRGRNKGILESSGKYISFLDSDDVALPNRLELTLPILETGEADVVYGAWEALVDGTRTNLDINNGQIIYSPSADLEMLLEASVPCQSTVTVRRKILFEFGFLKPEMKYREDHELWLRLAHFGATFKSISKVLTKLRLHAGNNELNFIDNDGYWFDQLKLNYKNKGPRPKKIAFILPGVGISGGIAVVFKHAEMLMKSGHDVTVINVGDAGDGSWFTNNIVPIVDISDSRKYLFDRIDLLFATGWSTAEWLFKINSKRKLYFVQSDERRFFDELPLKQKIHATYDIKCEYLTEAFWIRDFLHDEFGHSAAYVPNGIDLSVFNSSRFLESKGSKVRVLLEGPIVIPFKGMSDSYAAIKDLDCEIWIVSSAGRPPSDWRCDRFFESVPFGKMAEIYASCDIFLKMSRIEGFFGPPMEAMACGCSVVVSKVTGYDEYIVNRENALVVDMGDIESAKASVNLLINDVNLRERLIRGGYDTVKNWGWDRSAIAMLKVINSDSQLEISEP